MTAYLLLPVALPAVLGAAAVTRRRAGWTRPLDLLAAAAVLVCGLALLLAPAGGDAAPTAVGGLLRADRLTAYLLVTIGAVACVALGAALASPAEPDGWFTGLVCLFLAAMSLAVLADDLGVVWVAIEATTITTAFLVGYRSSRRSLEAAWKYVVLGSAGVAIAFLGIVLLYAATRAVGTPTLSWLELTRIAPTLDPSVAKLAVALTVLGLATKAGLVPMHSWLPDAHSQAPAQVSGLMSGVLLSVALYAVLRVRAVADLALGPAFGRTMLLILGLLSLGVAGALVLTQRDFKRLLAYSSIEHMGLMAVGLAIGGTLATTAVLVHMLGHGVVKAAMFVQAGRIQRAVGSSEIGAVHGLLARRPDLGGPFLAGAAALLGFPPFVLFFTEVAIVIAGWRAGLVLPMIAVIGLLLLAFAGIGRAVVAMTLGAPDPEASVLSTTPLRRRELLPVRAALVAAVLVGVAAWGLGGQLTSAVTALGGLR